MPTVPSAPASSWSIGTIDKNTAVVSGISVPSNGGAALDQILAQYNTTASTTGCKQVTAAGNATTLNLINMDPATTYYVRLVAHNWIGWGPGTAWKTLTTLPSVLINVGGVWKTAVPYVNLGGADMLWKPAVPYLNVGGVWKQ